MDPINANNLSAEFDSIKDDNEEILWIGKPQFFPYIFEMVWAGLFTIGFAVIWILILRNWGTIDSTGPLSYLWLFGFLPAIIFVLAFLVNLLSFSNIAYSYSDKRIMMRSGFIGTDFKTIDYDQIADIEVTVSLVEKIYHVGTIKFFNGRTETVEGRTSKVYDRWSAIENPYEVFKMVKQVSSNIKSDINYPNALRPDTNQGYSTKYTPKK